MKQKMSKKKASKSKSEMQVQSIESRIEKNLSELCELNAELSRATRSGHSVTTQPNGGHGVTTLPTDVTPGDIPVPNPVLTVLINAISSVEEIINNVQSVLDINSNMTGLERRRLFGVRSRKFGFITNAFDIVRDNPDFAPPNFDVNGMMKNLVYLERTRQLSMLLEQLRRLADDYLLTTCDTAYRDALRIYGSLREQSHNRVAGADALFQQLRQFFTLRRKRRPGEAEPIEPTEKEIERDLKRLEHGTADGEIIAKNVSPQTIGGVHEVIDNVTPKPRGGMKVVESAEFRE